MPIEKSAGAVIFRKENKTIYYLLLHYQAGHWDFPKGNIEKGEEAEEAAKREIFEETGIKDLKFLPDFQEVIKYFYKRERKNIFKIVIFFLAETKTKKVQISWEHIGFKWLPREEALKLLTFNKARAVLKKAHQYLK